MSYCLDLPHWMQIAGKWLYDWQALVAGGLAIIAAFIGARAIYRQTKQAAQIERDQLSRHHRAVRATLPLTLSGICHAAIAMLKALSEAQRTIAEPSAYGLAGNFDAPSPPTEHISELRQVIESTDDELVLAPLLEIIREAQTLWSRVGALNDQVEMKRMAAPAQQIDEYMLQSAQIYALAEGMFDYARERCETGPASIGWNRVFTALFIARFEQHTHPNLFAIIQRRSENLEYFWPAINER